MQGNTSQDAEPGAAVSPGLLRVTERAIRDPNARFTTLAHHLNVEALKRAYGRLRKDAAVGVDGVAVQTYGGKLEGNLADLHQRLRSKNYRHQPIRRVHIPKADGGTRPIGVSTTEDKIVQGALQELLEAIYEADFLPCSYGSRRGIGAHDALRTVDHMIFREGTEWILEADIRAFFDSLQRPKLREMLQKRVADENVMRLIGKCLHVGVLDGAEFTRPDEGTVQGSALSPVLGNIYLHHALDLWFEREVKPTLRGHARLVRYADDFIMGFRYRADAERTLQMLVTQLAAYGLELHAEKTRLIPFHRPPPDQRDGKGPGTALPGAVAAAPVAAALGRAPIFQSLLRIPCVAGGAHGSRRYVTTRGIAALINQACACVQVLVDRWQGFVRRNQPGVGGRGRSGSPGFGLPVESTSFLGEKTVRHIKWVE